MRSILRRHQTESLFPSSLNPEELRARVIRAGKVAGHLLREKEVPTTPDLLARFNTTGAHVGWLLSEEWTRQPTLRTDTTAPNGRAITYQTQGKAVYISPMDGLMTCSINFDAEMGRGLSVVPVPLEGMLTFYDDKHRLSYISEAFNSRRVAGLIEDFAASCNITEGLRSA